MRHVVWMAMVVLGFAGASRAAIDPATEQELDAAWKIIDAEPAPDVEVRGLSRFILEAAGAGWHPERLDHALDLAYRAQDRDPKSKTYGQFKWLWGHDRPTDQNAISFNIQLDTLTWMFHQPGLTDYGRQKLEAILRTSAAGMDKHHVAVTYTNIYLMEIWDRIAMGESLNLPAVAEEGYRRLDLWMAETESNGIREYLSPTYYGTDLDSLGLIARFAKRQDGRQKAEAALRFFWTDMAANWFAPAGRLGGAHGRDYDALRGHGYLDLYLAEAGWVPWPPMDNPGWLKAAHEHQHALVELTKWVPPSELREKMDAQVPRVVVHKAGANWWETAVNYVGKTISIGSSGQSTGSEDKPFAISFAGGPTMPVVSFIMDGRDDPYSQHKIATGVHRKAHHLAPFFASVQKGPDVLMVGSYDATRQKAEAALTCLGAHLILPAGVQVWVGDQAAAVPTDEKPVSVAAGQSVYLRYQQAVVGIRIKGLNTEGKDAAVELLNDGEAQGVMRLSCMLSATTPAGRGTAVMHVRAGEDLDEAGFAAFRKTFAAAAFDVPLNAGATTLSTTTASGGTLSLSVDIDAEKRLAHEGDDGGGGKLLLGVNGVEVGRQLLAE